MKTLGLHLDRPFLKAALLQKGRHGFKICALKSSPLEDPDHVKRLYPSKFKGRLTSGLSSKDLILKSMELNIGNTKHVEAALAFQSEGTSHLSPTDTLLVPHSIKKAGGRVEALLFTASREALRAHLEEFEKLHLSLDCVSSNGLALIHYVKWKIPHLSDAFLVDLGSSEWTCVWMEKGQLKKSYSIGSGTEGLLAALWEDRKKILLAKEVEEIAKQIDLQQIKPNLNPHLSSKLSEIRQELGRAILSFHRIANQRPVVFTGQTEAFGHLRDFLKESFQEAVSEEYHKLDLEEGKFAIPIGLALEQAERPLQLLREEFFPRKNWRRAGCYALTLFLFSLVLSFLLLVLGLHIIDNRKKKMVQSVQAMVEAWDPQLKERLIENEERAIEQWIAGVETYAKEYPYVLDAPRLAEVLSWLDNHPIVQECKSGKESFEVKDLRYQLLEYPKIGTPQHRYLAKVDLQFKVNSPMNARKFHEALLQGDALVDPRKEVAWEALSDGYRASFYLKPQKSPYVP